MSELSAGVMGREGGSHRGVNPFVSRCIFIPLFLFPYKLKEKRTASESVSSAGVMGREEVREALTQFLK